MLRRLTLLVGFSVLILGLLTVAETSIPETPGAHVGGTLVIASSQTFKDLDPRIMNDVYSGYVTGEIYDDLIALDPFTLEPRPHVAKSWEVISDEQVRFYLNEGIKFHNGEDLTAEDVAFTFNWIANEANNSPNMTELIWMLEAVVVDDYTVDIFTKPEYVPFAPGFSNVTQAIVPMDTVLAMGDDEFNLNPVGSGPYRFVEWLPGEHIKVERNEDYWLVYPNLDQVIYRPIPELSVMMLELESGGIDIADNMPAADIPRFQAMDTVEVLQVGSLSYFHMFFNLLSPISSDIRFRKAVYMSVDMDDAVFSIFQNLTGVKAYGCIPPALWANDQEYLRDNVYLEEDDEEAQRLFAELKAEGVIPEGYTVRIHTPLDPRRRQLATIMATNLIENGVDATVIPLDWGPLLELAYRSEPDPVGDFEMMWMGWSGGPDPHNFAFYLFHSANATVGSADNMSWTMIPEVDDLLDQAATTLDQAIREDLYVRAQRLVYDNYSAIPGYHYVETCGVHARVHGYIIDPLRAQHLCDPYHNVWTQERPQSELKIIFPVDSQIVWGTINVVVEISGPEASEVVFAYNRGEGFVDFAVDDGTVVDSDVVRADRFGTWDTSGLPTGDYTLQAQAVGADGQIVPTKISATLVAEPQVEIESSVIESSEEVTRVSLSASESSNPDLYQLSYAWIFADGSISKEASIKREFASYPVCHQAMLNDYNMLYELTPDSDEMSALKLLGEEISAGPCVEPVVLSYSTPDGMSGEETILVCIGPAQTALASATGMLILAPTTDVKIENAAKIWASDFKYINQLENKSEGIDSILRNTFEAGALSEEQKSALLKARINLLLARSNMSLASTNLLLGALDEAKSNMTDTRKALRAAAKLINGIDAVRNEVPKLKLASVSASVVWGRLRLVELIGTKAAEKVTSPAVASKVEYKVGGVWTLFTGSQYAVGSRHSKIYCAQFLVIQSSDHHDDDVILHEFGHHTMYKGTKAKLPGGDHGFNRRCTEELAWSEGWATFVQAVLQGHATFEDVEAGAAGLKVDIERDPKGYANKGPKEEGSVAAILWDLYDGASSGVADKDVPGDGVSIKFKYIWQAMLKTKTATSVGSIKGFYSKLLEIIKANDALKTKIKAIFGAHNVTVP